MFSIYYLFIIFALATKESLQSSRLLAESSLRYFLEGQNLKVDNNLYGQNIANSQNGAARLSDGNIVVVYESKNIQSSTYSVYGVLLNGNNLDPLNLPFLIDSGNNPQYYSLAPAVDAFSTGGFVVVWQAVALYDYDIYGVIYSDNTGQNPSAQFKMNSWTSGNQMYAKVKTLSFPDYVVVWTSTEGDNSGDTIFGKVMTDTTAKYNINDMLINTYIWGDQLIPDLVVLPSGEIVITWVSNGQDGDGYGIIANFFTQQLEVFGYEFIVNTNVISWQLFPVVDALDDGKFSIIWMCWNWSLLGYQVKGKIFQHLPNTRNCDVIQDEFFVSEDGVLFDNVFFQRQWMISLKNSLYGYLAVYTNSIVNGKNYGFYFQFYDTYGNKTFKQYQYVSEKKTPETYPPYAVELLDGSFAIIWCPYFVNDVSSESQVYAVQFAAISILSSNNLTINQGETLQLTTQNLDIISYVRSDTYFNVSLLVHCSFQIYEHSGIKVNIFTTQQIENGDIFLIHDGTPEPPNISFSLGFFNSNPQTATVVGNVTFQSFPLSQEFSLLSYFSLNSNVGANLALTPQNIGLSCYSCDIDSLWIYVISVANGWFASSSAPNKPLDKFSYLNLRDSLIVFINEKSSLMPIYQIIAIDNTSSSLIQNGKITLLNNEPKPILMAEFRIANDTIWDHNIPSVAAKSTGGYAVVWESDGKDGSGAGIFMQLIDSNCNRIGNEVQVNTQWYSDQSYPYAKYDSFDNLLVVFTDPQEGLLWLKIYFNLNAAIYEKALFMDNYTTGNGWNSNNYPKFDINKNGDLVAVYEMIFFTEITNIQYSQVDFIRYSILGSSAVGTTKTQGIFPNASVSQEKPCVVILDNSDFVVLWEQNDVVFNEGKDIYVNFPNEPPKMVNQYTAGDQKTATILQLYSGDFIIIWQSYGQDGDGYGIFGRKYFSNGTENGDEFQINSYFSGDQQNPCISTAKMGSFVVTWSSDGQDGSLNGIFAQIFDPLFEKIGSEFQVNTYTNNNQDNSGVAVSPNGCFFIAWQSFQQEAESLNSIYGTQYCSFVASATIVKQNTEFSISNPAILSSTTNNFDIGIVATSQEEFIIVWPEQDRNPNKSNVHIYAQINDKNGQKRGEDMIISILNPNDSLTTSFYPGIAIADDDSFVVVWDGFGSDYGGNDHDIYGQCFDSSFKAINVNFSITNSSSIFRINYVYLGYQNNPSVAMNTRGNFVVVWSSNYQGDGMGTVMNPTISGQIFGPNCTKIGTEFIITETPQKTYVSISVDLTNSGDFIVTWWYNGSTDQSWGRRYHSSGNPLSDIFNIFTNSKWPIIKFLDNNRYVLSCTVWNLDGYFNGIFNQIFNEDGSQMSLESQVNTYFLHDQTESQIGLLSDQSYFTVWQSDGPNGDGTSIRGQYFNSIGLKIGTEFGINTQVTGGLVLPAIAVSAGDNVLVAWNSEYNAIEAQRFRVVSGITQVSQDASTPVVAVETVKSVTNEVNYLDFAISDDEFFIYTLDANGNLQVSDRKRESDNLYPNITYSNFTNGQICCMTKYQNFLYIANMGSSLFVLKINEENSWIVTLENIIGITNKTQSLFIDSNSSSSNPKLYILNSNTGLQSYNLSNVSAPQPIEIISNFTDINSFQGFNDNYVILRENSDIMIIQNFVNNTSYFINLGAFGYSLDITKDGQFAFIGTSAGLFVFDFDSRFIISSINMQSIFNIRFSDDGTLLSICSEEFHLLYDTHDIQNLLLIKNTTFTSILLISQITKENNNIILLSDQLYLLKILTPEFENIYPSLTQLGMLSINQNSTNSIAISDDEKTAFISDYFNTIYLVDISDLNSSSFSIIKKISGFINVRHVIFEEGFLFMIDSSSLSQWQIKDQESIKINSYPINDPIDFILSNDGTTFYLVNGSHIYNIDKNTFKKINTVDLSFSNKGSPSRLNLSPNDRFLALACGSDGFMVFDLQNDQTHVIYTGVDMYDLEFVEFSNPYSLLLMIVGGNGLKIYELIENNSNNDFVLNLISDTFIAQNSRALKSFQGNYLVVQSQQIVTLILISNPSSPISLEFTTCFYQNLGYRFSFDKQNNYLILPSMEVIGLYMGNTHVYPFVKMSMFNNKKIFEISLGALSLVSGNSIDGFYKMLEIDIQPNIPTWVTTDIQKQTIDLFPSQLDDLNTFTKLVIVVYLSRQIDPRLFYPDEMNTLKALGFIDVQNYPTTRFDSDSESLTNNQKNTIGQHFFKQNLVFPLNSFLDLDQPPEISINISSQFASFYPNFSIVVGKKFDFTFSDSSLVDPDLDLIVYSAVIEGTRESWITFDSGSRRSTGTPTPAEKNSNIFITIIGSDGYKFTQDTLNFTVIKIPPNLKMDQTKNLSSVFNVMGEIYYSFPLEIVDVDGDPLTYDVKLFDFDTNETISLPDFMSFDVQRLEIVATLDYTKGDVPKVNNQLYYKKYMIQLNVSNIANDFIYWENSLVFENYAPYLKEENTLQNQFSKKIQSDLNSKDLQVEIQFEMDFDKDSFLDNNTNSNLSYTAIMDESEILPDWIRFDAPNLKLFFNPTDSQLKEQHTIILTADNGIQKTSDSINFYVTYSWIYILKMIAQIGGPILGIFGIFRKRDLFFSFLCKSYYKFKRIDVVVNESFVKDFYLIDDYLFKAQLFYKVITKDKTFMEKETLLKFLLSNNKNAEFIQILRKAKIELLQKNIEILSDFEDELLETNGTVFVIVKAFLLEHNFRQHKYLSKLYEEMKSNLMKEYYNNWYWPLVNFEQKKRNLKYELFPKVSIEKELIKAKMDTAKKFFAKKKLLNCFLCLCCCLKKKPIDENQMGLVYEMVLKDALGIPSSRKKFYHFLERAKGESILIPLRFIQHIKCDRFKKIPSGFSGKAMKTFKLDQVNLEISQNKKLPCWLDYEATLDVLRIQGHPTQLDVGLLVIQILDSNGLIVVEFEIDVLPTNVRKKTYDNTSMTFVQMSLRKMFIEKKDTFCDSDIELEEIPSEQNEKSDKKPEESLIGGGTKNTLDSKKKLTMKMFDSEMILIKENE